MFSGYLKSIGRVEEEYHRLQIPNHEIRRVYRQLIRFWFGKQIGSGRVEQLLRVR